MFSFVRVGYSCSIVYDPSIHKLFHLAHGRSRAHTHPGRTCDSFNQVGKERVTQLEALLARTPGIRLVVNQYSILISYVEYGYKLLCLCKAHVCTIAHYITQ